MPQLPAPYLPGTTEATCYSEEETAPKPCFKCASKVAVTQSGYHEHEWLCANCVNEVELWLGDDNGGVAANQLSVERAKYPLLNFSANGMV